MPEDDIKGDSSSLIWFIWANMHHISLSCYPYFWIIHLAFSHNHWHYWLAIGARKSWGLNFDVYHINSISLAKARWGLQGGTKKAPDPILIVLKWYWYLSLLVSSHPAGSETVKSRPASGHPGEDETFSRLTLKNDWARFVFAHGFGANSSACCGLWEAFQQLPLGKKRRKGSIHPTGITQVFPTLYKKEERRFWKACYKSVWKFHLSKFPPVVWTTVHFSMLKGWSSLHKNCRGCSQSPFTISLSTEHKLLALCVWYVRGSMGGKYPAETWWLLQWICKQQPQAALHLVIASRCALNSNSCI